MADDSIDAVRRSFEAFNDGAMDRFWALADDDVVVATDPAWPGGGVYRGRAEFERFLEQFLEAFGEVRFAETAGPERVGEWVLFRGKWIGRGASSGIPATSVEFSVASLTRDGLVRELRYFFSHRAAREHAAGH